MSWIEPFFIWPPPLIAKADKSWISVSVFKLHTVIPDIKGTVEPSKSSDKNQVQFF